MPLFKAWNSRRSIRKAVLATSLEEFISKSANKLGLSCEDVHVYLESDGTEIDDDDCFTSFGEGTVFVVGNQWQPVIQTFPGTDSTEETFGQSSPPVTTCAVSTELPTVSTPFESMSTAEKTEEEKPSELPTVSAPLESMSSAENSKRTPQSAFDLFTKNKYKNAKMKGVKIYTDREIEQTRGALEKKPRLFWNEKAEQLCSDPKQMKHNKTTIYGMVDVSWTLRKTGMLEMEANKLLHEGEVLFERAEAATTGKPKRLGKQKKGTIPKNVDRMNVAHIQVEALDKATADSRISYAESSTVEERRKLKRDFDGKMSMLDGAYTELKRGQEALSKSLTQKKMEIERAIAEANKVDESEPM